MKQKINKEYKIHHIAVSVNNLDKSIEFYKNILGFRPTWRFNSSNGPTEIQYLENNSIKLELTSRGDKIKSFQTRKDEARIKHISFEVQNIKNSFQFLNDKVSFISNIKEKIIKEAIITYFFITDPDGIEIEFIQIQKNE